MADYQTKKLNEIKGALESALGKGRVAEFLKENGLKDIKDAVTLSELNENYQRVKNHPITTAIEFKIYSAYLNSKN